MIEARCLPMKPLEGVDSHFPVRSILLRGRRANISLCSRRHVGYRMTYAGKGTN